MRSTKPRRCCCSCCGVPGSRACRRCPRAARLRRAGTCVRCSTSRPASCIGSGEALAVEAADDPMNRDPRFDRAYLRREVWPRIEGRWPAAAAALARAAQHLGEAQASLDASARRSVERLRDGDALSVSGLRALPGRERLHVVRHWLQEAAVEPPSTARLDEALRQILTAKGDHEPAVQWGEHALRRYRDRLFLTARVLPAMGEALDWPTAAGSRLRLGAGLGTLCWVGAAGRARSQTAAGEGERAPAPRWRDSQDRSARAHAKRTAPLPSAGRTALAARCPSHGLCRGNTARGRRSLAGCALERRSRQRGSRLRLGGCAAVDVRRSGPRQL